MILDMYVLGDGHNDLIDTPRLGQLSYDYSNDKLR